MKINILCIGDIVGRPGREILGEQLEKIVHAHSIDCVIVNAENAAGGSGLTKKNYRRIIDGGVDIITLGDHVYRKREIIPTLESANNIVRPANISAYASGKDYALYTTSKGATVAVVSLLGRVFMKPADCPFAKIDSLLTKLKQQAEIIVVEVHGEATSEKAAIGHYLDGKVSLVYGTHTHVPTADEQILPNKTGFITDIGMTGAHHSIIGRSIENVVKSMRTQMPFPFEIATQDVRLSGIIATIDSNTKHTESINRIQCTSNKQISQNYDSEDGKHESLGFF